MRPITKMARASCPMSHADRTAAMRCGVTSAGLPIGLQIVGPPFGDQLVLAVAAALEDAGVTIPPCPV